MSKALVIIPTYNELENIPIVLERVIGLPIPIDVLFVDDNSPDGSAALIKQYIKKFKSRVFLESKNKKEGLGKAYTHGFKWALNRDYDCIFEMDADLSHDPLDLVKMYKELESSNCDVVVGSRYINGINVVNLSLIHI